MPWPHLAALIVAASICYWLGHWRGCRVRSQRPGLRRVEIATTHRWSGEATSDHHAAALASEALMGGATRNTFTVRVDGRVIHHTSIGAKVP